MCDNIIIYYEQGWQRAGFLHTRARPAGQDPQPGPGPNINRVFFFLRGPDPPRWAPRAPFNLLGPNLAQLIFFLKPIELFFARLKPIHWAANLSPFKALLGSQFKPIQGIIRQPIQAHSLGSQFKPIQGIIRQPIQAHSKHYQAANSSPFIGQPINHNYKSINHQTSIHL